MGGKNAQHFCPPSPPRWANAAAPLPHTYNQQAGVIYEAKKHLDTMRSSLLGSALALVGIAPAFATNQFVDFSSLFVDVYSGSTGVENIVPYIESIDEDKNGVDDKYVVGFNVYANNGAKLFSATKKQAPICHLRAKARHGLIIS